METIERLEDQLDSLGELKTIVRTMKALSAASIREYERAVEALAGYAETVERGFRVVLADLPAGGGAVQPRDDAGPAGAIVFGSDHGLCGRFNETVAADAAEAFAAAGGPQPRVLAVGERAAASLEHAGCRVADRMLLPGSAAHITVLTRKLLVRVQEWQDEHGIASVRLYYNRHSGGRGYEPVAATLLPVDLAGLRDGRGWPSRGLPTYSMDPWRLLRHLIDQYLFITLFRACAESQASEHASRLAAMQSAEGNLEERLEAVTMTFRRARQNAITSELLDVVSGFEAITGGGTHG